MTAIVAKSDNHSGHLLPSHGDDWWYAPDITRLSQRAVSFDRFFVRTMADMSEGAHHQTTGHNHSFQIGGLNNQTHTPQEKTPADQTAIRGTVT